MSDVLSPAFNEIDDNNNTANQPSWPEFMPAANVNNAARALQGALRRFVDQVCATLTSSGSATNYVLTYGVNPDGLYNGQRFMWVPHLDCGASPNLNVNALGNKRIRKVAGGVAVELVAGDIQAGFPVELVYDLTGDQWILLNAPTPIQNASTTLYGTTRLATVAQLLQTAGGGAINNVVSITTLAALWEIGVDIVGAATLTLPVGGHFHITGTGWTATAIVFADTSSAGRKFSMTFDAAGGILKNGALLALPGGKDITVAVGDVALFLFDKDNVFRCISYQSSTVPAAYVDYEIAAPLADRTQAHTLGVKPSIVVIAIECVSADGGYAVGDRIYSPDFSNNVDARRGVTVSADTANIKIAFFTGVSVVNKGGTALVELDDAKWKYIIRAWR